MTVRRLGDTTVTVPAGSWSAYRTAIRQATTVTIQSQRSETVSDQILFTVDDVGIVMYDLTERSDWQRTIPTSTTRHGVLVRTVLSEKAGTGPG
jgi:hypothetical protein